MTNTRRDCVVQHHLKTQTKEKWINQRMEGQETDGNRKRESLIRVRDKMTSSTSKRKETAKKQIHVQKLLQMSKGHYMEETYSLEIVSCTKMRDKARLHVGHRRRIIRTRPTTLQKEGVVPRAMRRSHRDQNRPQNTGSSH